MHNQCSMCSLCFSSKQRVPYRGSKSPIFLFVGIAPGPQEDGRGVSFCGPAGQLLFELMSKSGLPESLCAWTNLVKCFPSARGGVVRDPTESEIDACCLALEAEILAVNPAIIVPLGGLSTSYFMEKESKITKVRGARRIVQSPSIRYRYMRMRKAIVSGVVDGIDQDNDLFKGVSNADRLKALKRAVKAGYTDVPVTDRVIFPTFHPSAILRGNAEAEYSILSDLNYLAQKSSEKAKQEDYKCILSVDEFIDVVDSLLQRRRSGSLPFVVYDIETTSLDAYDKSQYITTFGLCADKGVSWVIPYDHHQSPFKGDDVARTAIRHHANRLFGEIPVVGHNIKYDLIFSALRKIKLREIYDDTLLMARSIFNDQGAQNLEALTSKYTDLVQHKSDLRELQIGLSKDEMHNTDNYDLETIVAYNGADCDGSYRLYFALERMLKEKGIYEAHKELPARATIPVAEMEVNGCPLNLSLIESLDKEMRAEIEDGLAQLGRLGVIELVEEFSGRPFKIGSPEQVSLLLFDILELKPVKYGKVRKNGKFIGRRMPSVDKYVLEELKDNANEMIQRLKGTPGARESSAYDMWVFRYNVLRIVQEVKSVSKLHSSYIKSLPKKACSDGYVRPSYGIRKEETGRFNSVNPSLQIIPWHSKIKKLFVSRFKGGLIVSADESQMELRVFSVASGDDGLRQAFIDDKDLHRFVSSKVLCCAEDDVPTEDRRRIKTVIFGLLFGRGDSSIATQEGISKERAAQIRADIFREFPKISEYVADIYEFVDNHGYVRHMNGFMRNLPWYKDNEEMAAKARRQGINSGIQGVASDLIAQALISSYNRCKAQGLTAKLWNFVHDSLGYDVPPEELFIMIVLLNKAMGQDIMRRYPWLTVPLKVDFEVGPSWGELVDAKIVSLSSRTIEFSGKEEYFEKIIDTFKYWRERPIVDVYKTEIKQEPAVIRSLMKSSGEMIDYTHVTVLVQFPDIRQAVKPIYKYLGVSLFDQDEKVLA